jgi:hypothetical protein
VITTLRAPADIRVAVNSVSLSDNTDVVGVDPGSFVVQRRGDRACGRFGIDIALTVTNSGPNRSRATILTAAWPPQVVANGGACFAQCAVPALDPGQSVNLGLRARISQNFALGNVTIQLDPNLAVFDPIVSNNRIVQYFCGL